MNRMIYRLLLQLLTLAPLCAGAQLLSKRVSIDVRKAAVVQVLQNISRQGVFDFTYTSDDVARLPPVTLSLRDQPVKMVLDEIFRGAFSYKETKRHIILQAGAEKYFTISGYVVDATTGERLADCTVYDGQQLASALSDREGYFRLRLRGQRETGRLVVSKDLFNDEAIALRGGFDQQVSVRLQPSTPTELPDFELRPSVERTWLGRLAIGSKLRTRTDNLGRFFASRPYQASLIPGIGTHGRMGGQVVNTFSFNALGGYAAGANGFELAGVFNIDKKEVRALQIGGVFNIVGGRMDGVQIGGMYNNVLDSVTGVQIGGLANTVAGSTGGVQVAGIHNYVRGNAHGVQIAGIRNLDLASVKGLQIAGICNIVKDTVTGTQIAGIVNYARYIRGTQIGLVNIADSASGYCIGLLNIIVHGYHKVALYGTDVLPVNVAVKTGSSKFYSILIGGASFGRNEKAFSFGYGMGTDIPVARRWSVTSELSAQHLYLGNWDALNMLGRIQASVQWTPVRNLRLFAGPAYSIYYQSRVLKSSGYLQDVPGTRASAFMGKRLTGWPGWQAGIVLF